jgi:hypothetical protein
MADNHCESSSFLEIPKDKTKKAQAQAIVDRIKKELEENDEEFGCAEVEKGGVWFHGENIDHIEMIARALIEELEIDKPFYCSWAYTCSKPRIGGFGGGAFVVARGKETYWCNAVNNVRQQYENGGLTDLKGKLRVSEGGSSGVGQ